jgi:glycosyltransferase involved in cell wall biosynthesis
VYYQYPGNYPELAAAAKKVIAVTEYNRRYLAESHGVPPEKVAVIRTGIDPEYFEFREREARPGPVEMVTVARLEAVKGLEYSIRAVALVTKSLVAGDIRYTIVGDGSLRGELDMLIGELGLCGVVTIAGSQDPERVREHLWRSDIFLLPSLSEAMPVAIMEAMSCGLPVIATRVRGVPELVENGETGCLVEPMDVERLAEAMVSLVVDPELRKRMGRKGREKVVSEYTRTKELAKLMRVWRE